MADLYGSLPTFNAGQVLSASVHLGALQRFLTLAHDDVAGVSTPALGSKTDVIRHQWNLLEYSLTRNAGTITIKYNSTTVKTITSGGAQTGTADLSSFAFAVDAFYDLTVTGDCTVFWLREKQTTSYPALASFANDSTPTAEQWQALAEYADLIGASLDVPQPTSTRLYHNDSSSLYAYHALIHRGRWLKLNFRATPPHTCQDPRFIRVEILAGATHVFDQNYTADTTISTDIDLSAAGITLGQSYILTLIVSQTASCENDGTFWLYAMYEYPDASDGVAGWVTFKEWTHDNWVWGSDNPVHNAKKIQTIKANLQTLAAAIAEVAYATPERVYQFLFGVRRRRFLHYKTYTGESCTINWMYRGEAQQATLPESSTTYMAADLDSLEGLFPGTAYWIGGTKYALEDSHV